MQFNARLSQNSVYCVLRLYSDYLYFTLANKSAEDFHQKVVECVQLFQSCLSERSLRSCVYNTSLFNAMPVSYVLASLFRCLISFPSFTATFTYTEELFKNHLYFNISICLPCNLFPRTHNNNKQTTPAWNIMKPFLLWKDTFFHLDKFKFIKLIPWSLLLFSVSNGWWPNSYFGRLATL